MLDQEIRVNELTRQIGLKVNSKLQSNQVTVFGSSSQYSSRVANISNDNSFTLKTIIEGQNSVISSKHFYHKAILHLYQNC